MYLFETVVCLIQTKKYVSVYNYLSVWTAPSDKDVRFWCHGFEI